MIQMMKLPIQVTHAILLSTNDSDEHGNDSDDDCNNTNSNSMQPSKLNYDTSNNGNSGQSIHWNDIGAINDYISITDRQDSISSLTTETAPLTIFVHELFQMKNSLQTMRN